MPGLRRFRAVHLASPALEYLATAVTAAISAASAEIDQVGLPPNPTKCVIVPSDPVLLVSHEIRSGAASMARASPAATVATRPTSQARSVPRSRLSGLSRGSDPLALCLLGSIVPHQKTNAITRTAPAMADHSHQLIPVTEAVIARGPEGISMWCQRSSQPQACATAYSGARAIMNVQHGAEDQ